MAAGQLSFDFPDSTDADIAQRMTVPQKITIKDVPEETSRKTQNAETIEASGAFDRPNMNMASSNSMAVPERIVINGGFATRRDDFPRELQDDRLPSTGLGAMSTPPRTLTVDNTATAHYPKSRSTNSPRIDSEEAESILKRKAFVDHARFAYARLSFCEYV